MSTNLLHNKENRPGLSNIRGQYQFLPISPVRDQVRAYSTRPDSMNSRKNYNEVERLMDQNKVSRNLSEFWFKNSSNEKSSKGGSSSSSTSGNKPYNSYVKKIVKERLKYDE